jgi:hypothetical protein
MYLFISTKKNSIQFGKDKLLVGGWSEYKMNYDLIKIIPFEKQREGNYNIDNLLLTHFTHITNIWHLLHQLFICYKFLKLNNLNIKNMYPIFFDGFIERQGNLLECRYKDLIFDGMGFDYEIFKKIYENFNINNKINVNKLSVLNSISLNFQNEPMMNDFKKYIFKNLNLKHKSERNNLFIMRRGTREITNMDDIKKKLKNIEYVYLEDFPVKKQIEMYMNANKVIGVHGAGLAWCVFMSEGSTLIEMYPGNSNTNDYIRWCNITKVNYKRVSINITTGNARDFRNATVNLDNNQINILKKIIMEL